MSFPKLMALWVIVFAGVFVARKTQAWLTDDSRSVAPPGIVRDIPGSITMKDLESREPMLADEIQSGLLENGIMDVLRPCARAALIDAHGRKVEYEVAFRVAQMNETIAQLAELQIGSSNVEFSEATQACILRALRSVAEIRASTGTSFLVRYPLCFTPIFQSISEPSAVGSRPNQGEGQ